MPFPFLTTFYTENFGSATGTKTTIVYFLGGCTYAEIAALRFLETQSEGQREFIIATTKLINGNTLVESIIEPIDNKLV